MFKIKENRYLGFYYAFLLLVLVSWTSREFSPNIYLRILYTAFVVLPLLWTKRSIAIVVFTIFGIVSNNAYNYSYMPTQTGFYLIMIITVLLFGNKNSFIKDRIPICLWLILLLSTLVNFYYFKDFEFISESMLLLILLLYLVNFDDYKSLQYLLFSFSFASLFLSVVFLAIGNQYATTYKDSGFDRMGWMDANYFSTVVGMGVITSFISFLRATKTFEKIFLIATIVLSSTAIVLNASRGALMATGGALLVLFLISKVPTRYKVMGVLGVFVFTIVLQKLGYFELLKYRMFAEESLDTGSGRTWIWEMKLNSFFNDFSSLQQIFGVGFKKAVTLGIGKLGFHNDFVAFIVEYGVIGFILFVVFMFQPLFRSSVMRKETITCFTYIFLCCFSLEPLSSGRVSYYFYFLLYIMLSKMRHLPRVRI